MAGSIFFRRACAALAFLAVAPAALAADPEATYESGVRAAEEFRYAEALHHFTQAAAQGHRHARRTAGLMLLYGEKLYGQEIRQDRLRAMKLLGQAAGQGCELSTLVLKQRNTAPRG